MAALGVLAYHAAALSDPHQDDVAFRDEYGSVAGTILSQAGECLLLFFVLSGYLIARPFVRALLADEALPAIKQYGRNRILRIVPAFWVVFTVTLLIAGTAGGGPLDVIVVYLFAQGTHETPTSSLIVQGWTLGIEASFYLLVPIAAVVGTTVMPHVPSMAARRVMVLSLLTAAALASLRVPADGAFYRTIVTFLYAFIPGVALAVIEPARAARAAPPLVSIALAGVCVLAVAMLFSAPFAVPASGALACGAIVGAPLLLQRGWGRVWPVFRWRVLHWLGQRSYSIYLIHWGVLLILCSAGMRSDAHPARSFAGLIAVGTPITIALAAITFAVVERPFLRLRTRPADPRACQAVAIRT